MKKLFYQLTLLIIPILFLGCTDNNLGALWEARLQELKKLVAIGSDIDQALAVLEKSDFRIIEGKLKPTGEDGDYYSAIFLLIKDYEGPSLRNILYKITSCSIFYDDFSPFANIEADLNGKIYLIE
jgi:hypothetical protein